MNTRETEITLFATRSCAHRPVMEAWLSELGLEYRLAFVEENESDAERYRVRQSPTLVVDGETVFRGLPSRRSFDEKLGRGGEGPGPGEEGRGPIRRLSPRGDGPQVPEPVAGELGLYQVDATWGTIQPMKVAAGVRTVGEIEVVEHLEAGRRVVDARTSEWFERGTIPGADNIPHTGVVDRMEELDPSEPTIFFCNGPQCAQSPWAIQALLDAGYPAEAILYYRGGMHDWLTLGLPASRPSSRM